MRRLLLALLLLLPALGSACSLDSTTPFVPQIETTTFHPELNVDLSEMTRLSTGLYVRTLQPGTGETAAIGDSVLVRYTGWLPNNTRFDTNRVEGRAPFGFRIGAHRVIPGFEQGVAGMTVGSRRQLVIPPALGYGSAGQGQIPPNSILIFDVELVEVVNEDDEAS